MRTPDKPTRWKANRAANEFGVHRTTLARQLTAANIQPDDDGAYSIRDIHRALAGDLNAERIRETRAKADGLEMANAERSGKLLDADSLFFALADWSLAVVAAIRQSAMPHHEKEALLKHIRETDIVEIAKRSTDKAGDVSEQGSEPVQDSASPKRKRVGRKKQIPKSRGKQ